MNKNIFIFIMMLYLVPSSRSETGIKIDRTFREFFTSFCIECHNDKKKKGGVSLDRQGLPFEIKDIKTAHQWQKILTSINSKEMPPEDERQPNPLEKAAFLEMLSGKLVEVRKVLGDSGRKAVLRRLNNREYQNSINDILGVKVDVTELPLDEDKSHFNTNGESLYISAGQIEEYQRIANRAIKESFQTYTPNSTLYTVITPKDLAIAKVRLEKDLTQYIQRYERALAFEKDPNPEKNPMTYGFNSARDAKGAKMNYNRFYSLFKEYIEHPLSQEGVLLGIDSPSKNQHVMLPDPKTRLNGYYKIRVTAAKLDSCPDEVAYLNLGFFDTVTRDISRLNTFHITANPASPQTFETVVYYNGENNRLTLRMKDYKKTDKSPKVALWIKQIEWEGPIKVVAPPLIQEILTTISVSPSQEIVKSLLAKFSEKAFRGESPSPEYINLLYSIYHSKIEQKISPIEAIVEPLALILSSPGFIFMSEKSFPGRRNQLSQRELAIRLAYFLWSSPPDKELLDLAKNNKLRSEKALAQQVNRLLSHEKSENFIRAFIYQWLHMKRLRLFNFDLNRYHQFDKTMIDIAEEEVYQTVKIILNEDLNVNHLIKSDFIVINSLLANHYGISGVEGDYFRKVRVPKDSVRGGLTGMAAILAMGSDGTETSPVERGVWVLRNILNQPPPPAPANVPQLKTQNNKKITIKEMLETHQSEAQCSHCHKKIDPIGLGLENFDTVGKWRTMDLRNGLEVKIDPSGTIYKGPKFKNYHELRDFLFSKENQFIDGLISSLLTYSLGRSVSFVDEPLIAELQSHMKKNGQTLRALIQAIAKSDAFNYKN